MIVCFNELKGWSLIKGRGGEGVLTTVVGSPMSKMVISTDHNKGFQKAMHQIKA